MHFVIFTLMHIRLQTFSYSYTDMHMHPCDMHLLCYTAIHLFKYALAAMQSIKLMHSCIYFILQLCSHNHIHSCARLIALALTNALLHSRISTRSRCLARALSHSYYQLLCWACSTLSIVSMYALALLNAFYCINVCSRLLQLFLLYHRMLSPCSTLSIVSMHVLALPNVRFLSYHRMRSPCSTLSILASYTLALFNAFCCVITCACLVQRCLL
jgi:hypothetical protein